MLVYVHGAKCVGIEAVPVTVEVDITLGIGIHLVGLADAAVKESLLRTVTALQAKGFRIPGKKIVINLAPADLHKQGSGYDLPIALGIIAASEQRALPGLEKYLIMGELGLDGSIRYVAGTLPSTRRWYSVSGRWTMCSASWKRRRTRQTFLFGTRSVTEQPCGRNGSGPRRPITWTLPISWDRKAQKGAWRLRRQEVTI